MGKPGVIPDLLRDRAVEEPHRVALIVDGGEGTLSYRDWDLRSNAAARGLLEREVMPGDRVALYFENTEWAEFAVAYFGVVKAGAVAVPLSSRFNRSELLSSLERCGANGVVWSRHRPDGPGWHATVAEIEAGQSQEPAQEPVAPEDVAEILHTSGTTGTPKGVASRHLHIVRPLVDTGGWPPEWWRACAGGVYLHANAVSTAAGQLRLFEPLGPQRMTALALPMFDPDRFCRLADEHRADVVQLVPAMAGSILDSGAHRRHDLSSVRVVSLGCAPLPAGMIPKLAAAFPHARLVNMYELSEARHVGTALVHGDSVSGAARQRSSADRSAPDSSDPGSSASGAMDSGAMDSGARTGSVGRPRGASQVRVTDEQGNEAPAAVVGEVRVRWPGLPVQHYFQDAAATANVFVDGWTRTGDVGYLDHDGCLHIVDRLKDVIIKGGISISSVEVENALREHPAVADCAVFGVPDETHGEDVAAALVLHRLITPYDLRDFLSGRLSPHKVPQRFLRLRNLPRNRSGKVVKRELQARLLATAAPANGSPSKAPAGRRAR